MYISSVKQSKKLSWLCVQNRSVGGDKGWGEQCMTSNKALDHLNLFWEYSGKEEIIRQKSHLREVVTEFGDKLVLEY